MENIKIIRDKSDLEGTCYVELSLGKYRGKHWEETSLFFEEETFGFIEMIFERNIPDYDHYSMNDADSESWYKVIAELKELEVLLKSATDFGEIVDKVGFVFGGTRDYFQNHFQLSKEQLQKMVSELAEWAEVNIVKHGHIAILGI
ncbi:hypothetical protein [Pseudoalteromonas luteoviolacea]|uniref:Barstar (barnase inhibitor) domain-containing protein n=1 Tax=Pseudoalteromonas luteoviolacea S4060-1 TaxID=1365257 RepID=A0A162BC69_9GAMM|nr:hypothetical protein [Pseudoalteromonas luteoviolacea]KZN70392.1 hypothetical protein N478_00380 [Pseudoalteromonas luteoviolacea S4060-1]